MNRGSSRFQLIHNYSRFFGRDKTVRGIATDLASHLLIIAHVQGIARLHGCEPLVKIASPVQIAGLHRSVRQQLDDFSDVSALSSLLEEIEKFFQRSGILPHMPDDGMQIL